MGIITTYAVLTLALLPVSFSRPVPAEMRADVLAAAMLPLVAKAVNVVQSNDDGWAEINIRELYYSLTNAGFNSIISAPAENESGRGSLDAPPTKVGSSGCEFESCPAGSPPTGMNASMPEFHVSPHILEAFGDFIMLTVESTSIRTQ